MSTEQLNDANTPAFPTGYGQFDTHNKVKSDGTARRSDKAGTAYDLLTSPKITEMVKNPLNMAKKDAHWFIPSTYAEHDARNHDAQRQHGIFRWLTLDVDENDVHIDSVAEALRQVVGDARWLIYSSKSATQDKKKWRALIPLKNDLSGMDFADTQTAFFDLLEEASDGTLILDAVLARPAQLVYLPNRGEFYEHEINKGAGLLDLTPDHKIIRAREAMRARNAAVEAAVKVERDKRNASRKLKMQGDEVSPIEHFNADHSVSGLLARYGYQQKGASDHWRSPMQQTKGHATRDYGDYWVSLSGSDGAAEIGAPVKGTGNNKDKSSCRFGDAFDLYVFFEHSNDYKAAVRKYAKEAGLNRQREAIHKANDLSDFEVLPTQSTIEQSLHRSATSDGEPRPNAPLEKPELSHDAMATDLGADGFDADARYVASWGKWLFWTGTCWQKDEKLLHLTRVREFVRKRADQYTDWADEQASERNETQGKTLNVSASKEAQNVRSKTTIAAIESLARSNPASVAQAGTFDQHLTLLGTPGGTVDLCTGILRPAERGDMITKLTAYTPAEPGAKPERWLTFLDEIFDGDTDLVAFMQRVAGYALTGLTNEHKLLFLYGTGRNGKSVFLNTLTHIWADYSRRAAAETFLNSKGDKHATGLAGLQGARLVAGSELPVGKTWDESVIKDLTGGDRMTARFMRGDFFDFDPQLTLMIAGNNQPSFRGIDEAIRARVILIPFLATIPPEKRDIQLPEKLKAEGPEILRWAIEGAQRWFETGLNVPEKVLKASTEYLDGEDTFGQFLAEKTAPDPAAFYQQSELHQDFNLWCGEQGLNTWSLNTLRKAMETRGHKKIRRNTGAGYVGLKAI